MPRFADNKSSLTASPAGTALSLMHLGSKGTSEIDIFNGTACSLKMMRSRCCDSYMWKQHVSFSRYQSHGMAHTQETLQCPVWITPRPGPATCTLDSSPVTPPGQRTTASVASSRVCALLSPCAAPCSCRSVSWQLYQQEQEPLLSILLCKSCCSVCHLLLICTRTLLYTCSEWRVQAGCPDLTQMGMFHFSFSPGLKGRLWCGAVPINLHIGNMGVASAYPQTVDSVPPAIHGGNIDDRRIGKGATMYYPVQVNPSPRPIGCHLGQQGYSLCLQCCASCILMLLSDLSVLPSTALYQRAKQVTLSGSVQYWTSPKGSWLMRISLLALVLVLLILWCVWCISGQVSVGKSSMHGEASKCLILRESCRHFLSQIDMQVPGALLSLGDTHTAQGDSEFDGTAIETSTTVTLKLTLHKKGSLPQAVSKLNFPLLENANEYVVHGFTYNVSLLLSPLFATFLVHPLAILSSSFLLFLACPHFWNEKKCCGLHVARMPQYLVYIYLLRCDLLWRVEHPCTCEIRHNMCRRRRTWASVMHRSLGFWSRFQTGARVSSCHVACSLLLRIIWTSWTVPPQASTRNPPWTGPSLWPTTTPGTIVVMDVMLLQELLQPFRVWQSWLLAESTHLHHKVMHVLSSKSAFAFIMHESLL